MNLTFSISGDMDGLLSRVCRHAIEHTCTNRYFGRRLRAAHASPYEGAREDLEPSH